MPQRRLVRIQCGFHGVLRLVGVIGNEGDILRPACAAIATAATLCRCRAIPSFSHGRALVRHARPWGQTIGGHLVEIGCRDAANEIVRPCIASIEPRLDDTALTRCQPVLRARGCDRNSTMAASISTVCRSPESNQRKNVSVPTSLTIAPTHAARVSFKQCKARILRTLHCRVQACKSPSRRSTCCRCCPQSRPAFCQ